MLFPNNKNYQNLLFPNNNFDCHCISDGRGRLPLPATKNNFVISKFLLPLRRQMKVINKTQVSLLEIAIRESLKNYESRNEDNSLGDLYLYYDNEENILFFYDDLENLLNEVQIPSGEELSYHTLRFVAQQLNQSKFFEKDYIFKPFTISLTDKYFAVIDEVFFLDDDTIKLEGDIWPEMAKDLDNFLKDLIK